MDNTELYLLFIMVIVVINGIGFLLIGLDKKRARKGLWRISEKTLFLWALFGGALGTLLAMNKYRHKTKKRSFRILIPLFCVIHLAGFFIISYIIVT